MMARALRACLSGRLGWGVGLSLTRRTYPLPSLLCPAPIQPGLLTSSLSRTVRRTWAEDGLTDGPGIGVSGADAEVGESEGAGWSVNGDPDRIRGLQQLTGHAARLGRTGALVWVADMGEVAA